MEDWEERDFCEDLDEDLLSEFETLLKEKEKNEGSFLRNSDYNLDSGLLSDVVDEICKAKGNRKIVPLIFQNQSTQELFNYLNKEEEFLINEKWDSRKWLKTQIELTSYSDNTLFPESLPQTISTIFHQKEVWEIVEIFVDYAGGIKALTDIKNWTGLLLKHLMSKKHNKMIKNLFDKVLQLSLLVYMMNAIDEKEEDNLKENYPQLFSKKQKRSSGIEIQEGFFKGALLFSDFLLDKVRKVLHSRTHLLALKDTLVSRFNALLFTLITEVDTSFYQQLLSIYTAGDTVLKNNGQKGYNCIKTLEPFISGKLARIADQLKPTLPRMGEFELHIKDFEKEQLLENPGSENFYNALDRVNDIEKLGSVFGCYRHWGHPIIRYDLGLAELYSRVTEDIDHKIDEDYVKSLASDLARKLLENHFKKNRKWPVDLEKLEPTNPLAKYIVNGLDIPSKVKKELGDTWHTLPILPMFNISEAVDLKDLLDDKSHSISRSEFVNHIRAHPNKKIPGEKVLKTALQNDMVNQMEFLKDIDKRGLSEEDLIICVKEKEREMKIKGRFFAMMSYNMRLYFVLMEKILADHIVPLFDALTMTDNYNRMYTKLTDRTKGHGFKSKNRVTWTIHLDYSKWNNYQRAKSTDPVFKVLGQAFGMENLFVRTHEFFQKSWVYYGTRADQIIIERGVPKSKSSIPYVWIGQAGGLEGLRQKGWSIVSLLMLEKAQRIRNARVTMLAQGDNQVICINQVTNTPVSELPEEESRTLLQNADRIRHQILEDADKLGLIINKDETICSHNFLIYGKIIVFNGNLVPSPIKRFSRVSCVTNDQIPSLSSLISTVSTNALTVAQQSGTSMKCIFLYVVYSLLMFKFYNVHSPLLKTRPNLPKWESDQGKICCIRTLFLDPSLGGISGMSLYRFIIRQFPDPITEGLSFWRLIYFSTKSKLLKTLAIQCGNPTVKRYRIKDLQKLIENPMSLNIRGQMSPALFLKLEIKRLMIFHKDKYKNPIIKGVLTHQEGTHGLLISYLDKFQPKFPRFMSEIYQSSILGVIDSVCGLFQNSRTLRKTFSRINGGKNLK